MTTFGLTPTGFVPKTAADIQASLEAAVRAALDPNLDTSAESVIGQLIGVLTTEIAEVWQLGAAVYSARDPAGATFAQLDAMAALTGTVRAVATQGRVTLRLTVAPNTTIPAGAVAAVSTQLDNRWVTLADAVNLAGVSATVDVIAQAQIAGNLPVNAGQITVIATPVAGWTAVTNPNDASAGSDNETDPVLRARREAELSRPGSSPVPALRADLLDVRDAAGNRVVAACTVEENATQATDALGRPPHTVEAVVQFTPFLAGPALDAARLAFAQALFASKAGGIDTVGTHALGVLDPQGATVIVRWNEPTLIPIYVLAALTIDPDTYVGDAAVATAVKAFGDGLVMGSDVIRAALIRLLMGLGGVTDVVALAIGTSIAGESTLNVAIDARSLATFDTANITVTH